jgi:hypothetical protein
MANFSLTGDDDFAAGGSYAVSGDVSLVGQDVSLVGAAPLKDAHGRTPMVRDAWGRSRHMTLSDILSKMQLKVDIPGTVNIARALPPAGSAHRPQPFVNMPATLVQDRSFNNRRVYPVGLNSYPNLVPANSTVSLAITLPQPFRPTKFVIGSDIGTRFLISQLQIGKDLQVMTSAPISAVAFAENATDNQLVCDTVQTSQQISLQVTNITGTPSYFLGTLWGVTVQP